MALYVTDAHPLVWYAGGQHGKLPKKVLRIFEKAWNNQALIYVPAVVFWEMSFMVKSGELKLPMPFDRWVAAVTNQQGFDLAPLDLEVMTATLMIHLTGDPFDEAIVATARIKDLPLITADVAITESQLVEVVW